MTAQHDDDRPGPAPDPAGGAGPRCRFPGCRRPPAVRRGDRGRVPEFCGEADPGGPVHTRQAARAEQARRTAREVELLARAGLPAAGPGEAVETVPVDWARASLGALISQLQVLAVDHDHAWRQALDHLATATSSDVAAAQLRAGQTAAAAETAAARADAAAAQEQAASAAARADAAEADAEDARAEATTAHTARAAAETAAEQARTDADRAGQALAAEQRAHTRTRADLDAQIEATGEQTVRAGQAETAVARLQDALAAAVRDRDALDAALTDLHTNATAAAAAAAEREAALTDRAVRAEADLTATCATVATREAALTAMAADLAAMTTAEAEAALTATLERRRAQRAEADLDTLRRDHTTLTADAATATATATAERRRAERAETALAALRTRTTTEDEVTENDDDAEDVPPQLLTLLLDRITASGHSDEILTPTVRAEAEAIAAIGRHLQADTRANPPQDT